MKMFFATMALGAAMYAMPAQAIDISIAATGQTSSYYAYHAAVAKVIKEAYPDINITVMATGGSVENMRLIQRGQADWGGQFVEPTFYEDYAAIGSAKGKRPQDDLRFMWAIAEISLYNVVNADSDVKSISDLSGKNMVQAAPVA